jgi:hypothetical protein
MFPLACFHWVLYAGPIPVEIGELEKLTHLDISENQISGNSSFVFLSKLDLVLDHVV